MPAKRQGGRLGGKRSSLRVGVVTRRGGEQFYLQYATDDRYSGEVYRVVQENIPGITFRYAEAGMSYD